MPQELADAPDIPVGCEYLWQWFLRLNKLRPPAMDGAVAIPETEIRAYFQNREIVPTPWELSVIERLDNAALEVAKQSQNSEGDEDGS
jgi:hypothetical protein